MSNLSHWGRNKISAILQTTFSNTFSCKKIALVWFKLQWILLPAAHWKTDSMIRLGAQQAKTHYLITNDDQLYRYKYVALGLNELTRNIIYIIYICIYEYIYIYMLKIIYLSLQVIDNKHYHKTGTLHIGCNFWKSIWVKITMFYHIYILLLQNARNLHDMLIVTVVFGRYKWESFYGTGPRISQFTRVEIDTHGMYEWIEQFILGHYGEKGFISASALMFCGHTCLLYSEGDLYIPEVGPGSEVKLTGRYVPADQLSGESVYRRCSNRGFSTPACRTHGVKSIIMKTIDAYTC